MHHQRHPSRWRVVGRFISGRDLAGGRTTDATFFHSSVTCVTGSRWARQPGWKRALTRITLPPAAVAAAVSIHQDPIIWGNSAGAVGTVLAVRGTVGAARSIRHRRFRQVYVRPLTAAIRRGEKGVADAQVHVSPDLAGLQARLTRPMSPAQVAARRWYGTHIQPAVRWTPERLMRAYWAVHASSGPIRNRLDWFRIAPEQLPARVEITVPSGFVTKEQRDLIRQAVVAKIGMSDLLETCDQVGPVATIRFVVRERPPVKVGYAEIAPHLAGLANWEFIVGLTTGGRPVIISLDDDAPHISCSAGSGAGKSVLAMVLAAQVLSRGDRVTILDRKGSHRWARGLDGVTYCTKPAEMHEALIRLSALADQRNEEAMDQPEGWVPGHREFIIFEEMNATVAQLTQWWEDNREKSDPKRSPAISAFRNIMYMGRSAWVNLFGVAQMLTAQVTGGPEARENFGVRFLARYTANNWKMLAPECPMPKKSKTRGRWQVVIAGEATEVQVAHLSDGDARELAAVPTSTITHTPSDLQEQMGTSVDGDNEKLVTLQQAAERFCPGINLETLKKRRQRARAHGSGPRTARVRGRAELYEPSEIRRWFEDESLPITENTHV